MEHDVQIRSARPADLGFLEVMLFEAFHWDVAAQRPALADFRDEPEFRKLLAGWGRRGDRALVAEQNGERIGAAWLRLWTDELHSYGFVAPEIPELGIAVGRRHRSQGVGRALLRALIDVARGDGFSALSLSVSPANRALELYLSEGFERVGAEGTSWTLLRDLSSRASPCASGSPRA
jgi:ribosomal protein S18 acetylase RimI-like enzyme